MSENKEQKKGSIIDLARVARPAFRILTTAGRFLFALGPIGWGIALAILAIFIILPIFIVLIIALTQGGGELAPRPAIAAEPKNCSQIPTTLADTHIQKINTNMTVYKVAAAANDVPWEMLAAIHYLEWDNDETVYNPFQIDPEPAGVDLNDFQETANFAAAFLQGKATSGPVGRALTQSMSITNSSDEESIKDAFWGYNGRADYQTEWAEEKFGVGTPGYEGSAYVMNNWDSIRQNMPVIGTILLADGTVIEVDTIATRDGTWKVFVLLKSAIYDASGNLVEIGTKCDIGVPIEPGAPVGCPMRNASVSGYVFGSINKADIGPPIHQGIDIDGGDGTNIIATMGGEVIMAKLNSSAGYEVKISNGQYSVRFLHMYSDLKVSKGDNITQGTVVGRQNSSSTISLGTHLHYEVHKDGVPVDPALYIPMDSVLGATCGF